MQRGPAAVLMLAAMLVGLPAQALTVPHASVEVPEIGAGSPLTLTTQAGEIRLHDSVLNTTARDVEVVEADGYVRITVPWSFVQSQPLPPLAPGQLRTAVAVLVVIGDHAILGLDLAYRLYSNQNLTWDEHGNLTVVAALGGPAARHVLLVTVQAGYYDPRGTSVSQQAYGSVIANGPPAVLTSVVQTGPSFTAAEVALTDARANPGDAGLDSSWRFVDNTILAPDRVALAKVPYSFRRATEALGTGWEEAVVEAIAIDDTPAVVGPPAYSVLVRDFRCCAPEPLAWDVRGELSLPLSFQNTPWLRHQLSVLVIQVGIGELCPEGGVCAPFLGIIEELEGAGVVYAPPDRLPTVAEVGRLPSAWCETAAPSGCTGRSCYVRVPSLTSESHDPIEDGAGQGRARGRPPQTGPDVADMA